MEKATGRLLGATFSSTSGKCKHGIQSKGFEGGVGIDMALKQRMEEENTLNLWAWIGAGNENITEMHPNFLIMPCDKLINET